MKTHRKVLLGATICAVACGAVPAHAVNFVFTDTGGAGAGTEARRGFDIAAAYWSSVLTNASIVRLDIGFNPLGPGVLASTGSSKADISLTSTVNALSGTGSSSLDTIAMSNLRPRASGGSIAAITNGPLVAGTNLGVNTSIREYDNDGSENNRFVYGNTSVFKAIGLTENEFYGGDFSDASDGSITFSSTFNFDFNPTDGLSGFDFIGVAIHEIGHALGFSSGVDLYDFYGAPNGPGVASSGFDFDNPGGGLMTIHDLFRYSNDPLGLAGGGPTLDWSVADEAYIAAGGNPYFSIDGGQTQLFGDSRFSTGRYNGDGEQASHWKDRGGCSDQIGILDPNFCNGQVGVVTAIDLAAFDAMGWNISFDVLANSGYSVTTSQIFATFVPEPSTWAQMILGFGTIGGAMRRRPRSAASVVR
jgi:hypothetical protein